MIKIIKMTHTYLFIYLSITYIFVEIRMAINFQTIHQKALKIALNY